MGGSQSNSFSSDLGSYKVVDKSVENNITYLLHSQTEKEYLLRQFTFNDENIYKKNMTELEKRKTIESEHLTQLKRVQGKTIDHLCSNVYKIYAMWEYPQRYLSTQINERALQKRKFEEKQLWSILASLILGMSTLQKNKIKHECLNTKNILLDNEGLVKAADPLATGTTTNLDIIYNNRHAKSIYLSPQQCESLDCRSIYSNPYKNDVWSMGMILLQCGLLERQDPCYKDEYQRIDYEQLQKNIRRFGLEYSEELRIITEVMLKKDNKDRPDWLDLQQYTKKSSDKSQIVDSSAQKSDKPPNTSFSPIYNYENSKPKPYLPFEQQQKKTQNKPPLNVGPYQTQQVPYPQTVRSDYFYQPVKANPPILNQANRNPPQPQFQQTFVPFPPTVNPVYNQNIETNSPNKRFVSQFPTQNFPPQNVHPFQSNPNYQNPYMSLPNKNLISSENQYQQFHHQFKPEKTQQQVMELPFQNNPMNFKPQEKKQNNEEQFKTFGKRQTYEFTQNKPLVQADYKPPMLNTSVPPNLPFEQKPSLEKNPPNTELQYVIETFKQGSRYEGYKLDDMRHGQGKFYYQDGGMYDGSWNRNKMDGYGSLYYQSGKLAYQGMWRNDQFQGKGKLFNEAPQKLEMAFDYRNFDEIDEYWEYYEGDFIEDLKKGKGKLMLSNGQYFEGTFENDMVEGVGKFFCANGKVVEGVWQSNQYISS